MFDSFLDILFPKNCINCGREGNYLCEDCLSLIDINPYYYCLCNKPHILTDIGKCSDCKNYHLDGLLSASSFGQRIVKEAIRKIKHDYIKEISQPLSFLILTHLLLLEKDFPGFLLLPVPLSIRQNKRRGFNQSEEIGILVSKELHIPLLNDVLFKIRDTKSQTDLDKENRIENIKDCFEVKNNGLIKNKSILLLDDLYATGSTMNECARVLKENGAEQVVGLTVARDINFI